jgi:apolipoprotein N-acyltransferase
MNLSWYTRALLALASGAALALSFPNYNLTLLAWVAITPLILASCGSRPAVSPLYGFLHGLVFYPVCLPWIDVVMHQYGNVNSLESAGILGLIAIVGGILCSFFSWGVALASRKSRPLACLLAPLLWVTVEFVRGHLPIISFPWNLAGYAASGNIAMVQLTTVTGIWGLSFVVSAYSALVAYAILTGAQRVWKTVIVTTAVLLLVAFGGYHFVPRATPQYVAHLVQTNFAQSYDYPPDWMLTHAGDLDQLEQISVDAAKREPGLIVWPEVPAPFTFHDPAFVARAARLAQSANAYLLVGIVDWKAESGKWIATNSAVLLNPSGARVFTYDKIHLVPFGEYVPLRRWLTFAGKLTADIGDFTPGNAYRVGELPGGSFGTFICYEGTFPNLVRQFTKNGAELLINMSNDGWFGRSSAPAQHLMMERVRAVENRRWLLRDTNNGFTVDVDPYGRIVAALPTDIRGQLDAPYSFRSEMTPYARFGDWFAWLSIILSFALFCWALLPRER